MPALEFDNAGCKVRVWFGEWPQAVYEPVATRKQVVRVEEAPPGRLRQVAVELGHVRGGHPSTYGLLGAQFLPDESDQLAIEVLVSGDHGAILKWALISTLVDYVQVGLPGQYVNGVLEGVEGAERLLGSGRLRFACAAHALYGSSHLIFKWLARLNVKLLAHKSDSLTNAELAIVAGDIIMLKSMGWV